MGVRKRAGRSGVEGGFGVDHPIGGRGWRSHRVSGKSQGWGCDTATSGGGRQGLDRREAIIDLGKTSGLGT